MVTNMQETNTNQDLRNETSDYLNWVELSTAKGLASSGLHPSLVAKSLGFTSFELVGPHADDLDSAAEITAKNTIDRSLFEMAASNNSNAAATIFWAKSYGYPATTAPPSASADKPEKKKPYVWDPNDPNDRVIFSVYNNDGEPNHDY